MHDSDKCKIDDKGYKIYETQDAATNAFSTRNLDILNKLLSFLSFTNEVSHYTPHIVQTNESRFAYRTSIAYKIAYKCVT